MKELFQAEVVANQLIGGEVYDLYLRAPKEVEKARAGQFLSVFTGNPSMILPRPLSICELDKIGGVFRIVYRAGGDGTKEIAKAVAGDYLGVLGPLGTAFKVNKAHKNFAIVGGGIGVPPLLELSKRIRHEVPGSKISVFLGFRSKYQVILEADFKKYVDHIHITTDDGTYGTKGNNIAVLPPQGGFDIAYGCGPLIMLKFLAKYAEDKDIPCVVSTEEHMACSVGACMACVIKVKKGNDWAYVRVCCTGPVFDAKELIWE
ncbi:MAG: dihydroorotate dehydrogenase electron transfer subunit [Defluviitaleaceae bacterium]|nr:dihydroorotate dehydrogenase electron transfer subunit [Defluviitaleaceae bacterium]